MPPYWALGFHLCRWGYNNLTNMKAVRARMLANQIPQDVQWNDIDYMKDQKDFTIDPKNFGQLSEFVDELHAEGMHYVLMTDPAISVTPNYEPFTTGVEKDVFVKDFKGEILRGKVWPGTTAFPDFFHPNVSEYWYGQISKFHEQIKFDGLWIDMNEPSNFVHGSLTGCPDSKYEKPPYTPAIIGGELAGVTICMTATQMAGKGLHYNLHSLYGYSESVETMKAVRKTLGKRSLVISRSTFSGSGHHAGHWLGDNHATWDDLYLSIAGILNFNIFGVPMVGADICGFQGDTTEELCARWMQLGAFYPFSRNHNDRPPRAQDPAAFGELLASSSKAALETRYALLPYLYTLLCRAHTGQRGTVARPLFFEFPKDHATAGIDSQFMWGSGLMISPVLQQSATSVKAYIPAGRWYEFHNVSRALFLFLYNVVRAMLEKSYTYNRKSHPSF